MKKSVFVICMLLVPCMILFAQEKHPAKRTYERELINEFLREKQFERDFKYDEHLRKSKKKGKDHKLSNLVTTEHQEGEPFIAQNPNSPGQLAISYMHTDSSGLVFPVYYSNDSGNTWNRSSFNTRDIMERDFPDHLPAGGGDPVMVYDEDDNLVFTWIYAVLDTQQARVEIYMYWAESVDNAKTFNVADDGSQFIGIGGIDSFTTNPGLSNFGEGLYDRQWLDVDRSGGKYHNTIYMSCLFIPNDSSQYTTLGAILKFKRPGEDGFSPEQVQVSDLIPGQSANVAVDGNGNIHYTYLDLTGGALYYKRSVDGGETFSPAERTSTPPGPVPSQSSPGVLQV